MALHLQLSRAFVTLGSLTILVAGCTSDLECSLNGVCQDEVCECDRAWSGDACDRLAIMPHPDNYVPAYGWSPNVSSWGGNMIFEPKTQLWHLYVAEMADDAGNFCGLHEWQSHSRVAHAVSKDPMGVFKKVDVALPQEAHNPSPMYLENGSSVGPYLLFHIGSASAKTVSNCSGPAENQQGIKPLDDPDAHSALIRSDTGFSSFLHTASNPNGPWTPQPAISCNNPAPMQHPNGRSGRGAHRQE